MKTYKAQESVKKSLTALKKRNIKKQRSITIQNKINYHSHFSAAQNNKIQRNNTNICCIYKSILASSDSFCLITSHIMVT